MPFPKKYLYGIFLSASIVILDLFLKTEALSRFNTDSFFSQGTIVTFGLHKNPGIIFDIPIPQPILWTLTLVLIAFLVVVAQKERHQNPKVTTGAVITIIGALGNFIDRVQNGFTTDYLIFFTRSAINLSDIVIIGGVLLILFAQQNQKTAKLRTETD